MSSGAPASLQPCGSPRLRHPHQESRVWAKPETLGPQWRPAPAGKPRAPDQSESGTPVPGTGGSDQTPPHPEEFRISRQPVSRLRSRPRGASARSHSGDPGPTHPRPPACKPREPRPVSRCARSPRNHRDPRGSSSRPNSKPALRSGMPSESISAWGQYSPEPPSHALRVFHDPASQAPEIAAGETANPPLSGAGYKLAGGREAQRDAGGAVARPSSGSASPWCWIT